MEKEFDQFKDNYYAINKDEKISVMHLNITLVKKFTLDQIITLFNFECEQDYDFNFNLLVYICQYNSCADFIFIVKLLRKDLKIKFLDFIKKEKIKIPLKYLSKIIENFELKEKVQIIRFLELNIYSYKSIENISYILQYFEEDKYKIKLIPILIKYYVGEISFETIKYVLSQFIEDSSKYILIKSIKFSYSQIDSNELKNFFENEIRNKRTLTKILEVFGLKNHLKVFYGNFVYDFYYIRKNDSISFHEDSRIIKITKENKKKIRVSIREKLNKIEEIKYFHSNIMIYPHKIVNIE